GVWGNRSRPLSFSNAMKVERAVLSAPQPFRIHQNYPVFVNFIGALRTVRPTLRILDHVWNKLGPRLLQCFALAILCLVLTARAENAVILESFEESTSCATLVTNSGGRPIITPPGVTLSSYTKQNPGDLNVTEGKKSLKIVL